MPYHYAINEDVLFHPQEPQGRDVPMPQSIYTVTARMPIEADGRFRYRIKSKTEKLERVVTEEAGQEWRAFSRAACTIRFMTNHTFKSGESREQPSLFPPRIEDYVGPATPVRAIDSFVCALDLAELGFRYADRRAGVGQPPYDPSDLLKLYLYGYINQIRSSRR